MQLDQAREIGLEIIETLTPGCEQIVIAGSIRRDKPEPKDVEIVYRSKIEIVRLNLFENGPRAATERLVGDMVQNGTWRYDDVVRRNGPRYKRLIYKQVVIELFRADCDNWGYILALRTGPGEFNKLWATKSWAGGCCPLDIELRSGYLWRNGKKVTVSKEADFFNEMRIPHWPPAERNPVRLAKWMRK